MKKIPRTDINFDRVSILYGSPIGPQIKFLRNTLNVPLKMMQDRTGTNFTSISHLENNSGPYKGSTGLHDSHITYLKALGVKQVVVKL